MNDYDGYQLNTDAKEKLIWENNNQNLCEVINEWASISCYYNIFFFSARNLLNFAKNSI